jgi:hypothetical protein
VDKSIVLYKQVPIIKLLKNKGYFYFIDLKVQVSKVLMLCRLKITVYDIAIAPLKVLKGSLDHDLHVLTRAIGLNHLFIPLLCRRTKAPLPPFTPPPLHRTLVTLAH